MAPSLFPVIVKVFPLKAAVTFAGIEPTERTTSGVLVKRFPGASVVATGVASLSSAQTSVISEPETVFPVQVIDYVNVSILIHHME